MLASVHAEQQQQQLHQFRNAPSTPSRLCRSQNSRIWFANVWRDFSLAARAGNSALALVPPTDTRVLMCGFLRFSSASAAKQPCCPSVGFCRSAHSSRSYSVATVSQILDSCCSADGATHPEGPVFRDTVEWRSAVYELDQHYARVRDSPNEGIEYMGNGRSIQCPRCFIFVRPPRGIVDGIHAGGRPGRPMSEPKRHFLPNSTCNGDEPS